MSRPLFSIIIVTWNQLQLTVRCAESLLRTMVEGTEIIFVDNGSSDGTCSYLNEMTERYPDAIKTIFLEENQGWCRGVNRGLEEAQGKYLVMLNNDIMLTSGWLECLRDCMDNTPTVKPGVVKVGLVGPVSNSVGGPQQISTPDFGNDVSIIELYAQDHRRQYAGQWRVTSFISGFCLVIHRDCYEEIGGLDERFSPGGFDDNDLVLRAQEKGWTCMIAEDVFVFHEGSATFKAAFPEKRCGMNNRPLFSHKWRERRAGGKRLVAAYRVKNCAETIEESLDSTAQFADEIVVLDDGSTDGTSDICKNHPGVSCYEYQELPFDERRDRNRVLKLAERFQPDWIISIDGDEVFEMDRQRCQRLMHLNDPHTKVLGFHWYTFWEPSHTYFRVDGIFGQMSGFRMYKWEPNQSIVLGTPEGLHCGNIPQFPDGAHRYTNVRVRHLGYDSEEKRHEKYNFYRQIDKDPRAELVGNTDYSHLISPTVVLGKYKPQHGISLCIITKNEEDRLESFLSYFEPFVDEICVVDTESTDRTLEIAGYFANKIDTFKSGKLELDKARNRSLALASQPWILSLDPDEEIDFAELPRLQRMVDDAEAHAYSFQVVNHQKDGPPIMTLAYRLFRNDRRIYYSRPVHETIEESLRSLPGAQVKPSPVKIQHFGYLKADDNVQEKLVSYHQRIKEYREANPEDPLPWYSEALHYLNDGQEENAISFLIKALELDPSFMSSRAQLAYVYQERAISLWRGLVDLMPADHPAKPQTLRTLEDLMALTPPRPLVGNGRKHMIAIDPFRQGRSR